MAEQNDDKATDSAAAITGSVDAVLTAQLAVLQAELTALKALIPGAPQPGRDRAASDDAEIESNFDNMPV